MGELSKPEVPLFPTIEEASQALAENLLKVAENSVSERGSFSLALSGGRTPRYLFALLAEAYSPRFPWGAVHLFWADERCVPREHPESNTEKLFFSADRLALNQNIPGCQKRKTTLFLGDNGRFSHSGSAPQTRPIQNGRAPIF